MSDVCGRCCRPPSLLETRMRPEAVRSAVGNSQQAVQTPEQTRPEPWLERDEQQGARVAFGPCGELMERRGLALVLSGHVFPSSGVRTLFLYDVSFKASRKPPCVTSESKVDSPRPWWTLQSEMHEPFGVVPSKHVSPVPPSRRPIRIAVVRVRLRTRLSFDHCTYSVASPFFNARTQHGGRASSTATQHDRRVLHYPRPRRCSRRARRSDEHARAEPVNSTSHHLPPALITHLKRAHRQRARGTARHVRRLAAQTHRARSRGARPVRYVPALHMIPAPLAPRCPRADAAALLQTGIARSALRRSSRSCPRRRWRSRWTPPRTLSRSWA